MYASRDDTVRRECTTRWDTQTGSDSGFCVLHLPLEDVTILVSGLVLVVELLDEFLVLDILLDVRETDQIPNLTGGLLVLSALSLLVLRRKSDSFF